MSRCWASPRADRYASQCHHLDSRSEPTPGSTTETEYGVRRPIVDDGAQPVGSLPNVERGNVMGQIVYDQISVHLTRDAPHRCHGVVLPARNRSEAPACLRLGQVDQKPQRIMIP